MATIPEIVNYLEADDALHLGRLLILIDTFGGRNGDKQIEGLTKLAKLDFLLRYPQYLERALHARNVLNTEINVQSFERHSIEARMVRFKYGPWDYRYRRFLNILAGRGLAIVGTNGRKVMIGLTEKGREAASLLRDEPEYDAIRQRATLLKRHLDITATNLMNLVYNTFPELTSLRLGEVIES